MQVSGHTQEATSDLPRREDRRFRGWAVTPASSPQPPSDASGPTTKERTPSITRFTALSQHGFPVGSGGMKQVDLGDTATSLECLNGELLEHILSLLTRREAMGARAACRLLREVGVRRSGRSHDSPRNQNPSLR